MIGRLTAALIAPLLAVPAAAQVMLSGGPTMTLVYAQTGLGPQTTGAGTATLMGGPAAYGFGAIGGLPQGRCSYPGETTDGRLKGNYELAATTPGSVRADLIVGGTTVSTTIGNLVAGTPGQWWDADATIVCVTPGTTSATVMVGATITYQAIGGVTAAQPVNRLASGPITIAVSNNLFTIGLSRNFTNGANKMQIEELIWVGR